MTFEEILPHLRAGKKIIRTSELVAWSKLQNYYWYEIPAGSPPILRQLFGNGWINGSDLEAQDWEICGELK